MEGKTTKGDALARRQKYIAVIGAGSCDEKTGALAHEVGRLIAHAGAVLVCGGAGGVMAAACQGAQEEGGITLGILAGLDRTAANRWLDFSICTGVGHARNLAVAASGDAVIAIGGEFGTLSEIGLAAKIKRPLIMLFSWELSRAGEQPPGVTKATTPQAAVELAIKLTRRESS